MEPLWDENLKNGQDVMWVIKVRPEEFGDVWEDGEVSGDEDTEEDAHALQDVL